MKALVLSDVHANITALEAVWNRESDADLIVCAGDLVDYGPHPRECLDWMIAHNVRAVMGNHDLAVIAAREQPAAAGPLLWRMENARQLAQHHLAYLRQLPETLVLELNGAVYGMTHAYDEDGYSIPRSVEAFASFSRERFGRELSRLIFGHTHRRELVYLADDVFFLNPGSVSYRRDDERWRGAHYAVIVDGRISLRSAPYPTAELYHLVTASPVCDGEKAHTYRWWAPRPGNEPAAVATASKAVSP